MKNSLHEIKEIQWDWDEDDNGDVVEFVVIDGEKYVDVSYFNQKLKEKEDRFEPHKNTDAKTIQDQSDLIEELKSKIKKLTEEIDFYNSLTPDKADWMAQYLGLLRDTNDERSLLEKEISDLETKFAEMTEKYNACQEARKLEIEFNKQDKVELKQQLARTQNELSAKVEYIHELVEVKDDYKQQLAEKDKTIENLRIDLKDYQDLEEKISTKYDKVVEKLAEKEKEIEKLKSENHALMSDNAHQEADIFELNSFKEYYKNNKISFAVEQLNQAKGKIQHNILFVDCDDYVNVIEEIDNQIKQLKEMPNEK